MVGTRRLARNTNHSVREYREESSDAENPEDEYEEPQARKRVKHQSKAKPNKKRTTKRKVDLDQAEAELPENGLYQALSRPEIDTQDLALEWIESYEEDSTKNASDSITMLVNLVLRSCGSVHLFQPHDIVNLESAAETVGELTIAFGEQQSHRFPFKAFPVFKTNVLNFFEFLIETSHEKGLLYKYDNEDEDHDDEDELLSSPLMTNILTWISSLSSSTIRPLRYVSTVVLLTIQNKLCSIINTVVSGLEKAQRQLFKITKKNTKKFESLTKTVETYHHQKETIIEYFNEIGNVTLGHRYRDIDPIIRQDCLKYLSQAMIIYPEHFFQATFLRYYGWLLSDPANSVRIEVSKVLLKLYKNATNKGSSGMTIGFRQFTERYKLQFIKMSKIDADISVRLNTIGICCELLKIGFLDENDNMEIISNYFQLKFQNAASNLTTQKFKLELAKFIAILNLQIVDKQMEKNAIFIDNYDSTDFGDEEDKLQIKNCLKVKSLIKLLQDSVTFFLKTNSTISEAEFKAKNVLVDVFGTLYQLPTYDNTWESLVRYILLDPSSIVFTPKEGESETENLEVQDFKQLLELLEEKERVYLLSFINGAIANILSDKSKKLQDQISIVFVKLVDYLPSIRAMAKSGDEMRLFLSLWNNLIESNDDNFNIFTTFNNLGQIEMYNQIMLTFLKYYQSGEFDEIEDRLILGEYDSLFGRLLSHYKSPISSGLSIMTSQIKLDVQSMIQEIVAEFEDIITSRSRESTPDDELRTQKELISEIVEASGPLSKLRKLGDHIEVGDICSGNKVLKGIGEMVKRFDICIIARSWANNFVKVSDEFLTSLKIALDCILVSMSWKLERLIHMEEVLEQSQQDIIEIFENINTVCPTLEQLLTNITELVTIIGYDSSHFKIREKFFELKTLIAAKFIDLIVSLRVFYVKFKNQNNFKNFEQFFGDERYSGTKYVSRILPLSTQQDLLALFLYKEVKLAKHLGIELDRTDDEDVNLEELVQEDNEEPELPSMFDSDDETDGQEHLQEVEIRKTKLKQEKAWLYEKELCVFTLKIFTLVEMVMVNEFVLSRVELNSEKLGGIFLKIVKNNHEENEAAKRNQGAPEPINPVAGMGASPTIDATSLSSAQITTTTPASIAVTTPSPTGALTPSHSIGHSSSSP